MELFSYNNLWYGIPLYVEFNEEEYEYEEDSGRVAGRTARRSKRAAPVCRAKTSKVYRDKRPSRRNTRDKTLVKHALNKIDG
jgi:hypothetical protein